MDTIFERDDLVRSESLPGVWEVFAIWPGKPLLFLQQNGDPRTRVMMPSEDVTMVKKAEPTGSFFAFDPRDWGL